MIGLALGFGVGAGMIITACIVWRCCCSCMRNRGDQKKSASNRVGPGTESPAKTEGPGSEENLGDQDEADI